MIGTIHFERVLFTVDPRQTPNCQQIIESGQILNDMGTDGVILMGDTNLTGGKFLSLKINVFHSLDLVDVLNYLNPNLSENDTDPKFR